MKTNRKIHPSIWMTGILFLILTIYSAHRLLGVGTLSWHVVQPETRHLFVEMMIVFVLLIFAFSRKNSWLRIGLVCAVTAVFCWIHMVFVPMAVAAVYLCFLYELGKWFRTVVLREDEEIPAFADGLFGAVLVVILFCVLSLFGIGGARKQLLVLGFIGLPLAVWVLKRIWNQRREIHAQILGWRLNWAECLTLAGITALILLQAGRMNLTIDYDSLWYGLRSEYILDNGKGIYENLGTLGVVYTYSKAQEILLLPFASLPSHAFLLSFSLYFTVIALWVFYRTAKEWMNDSCARFAAFLLATVPAVMNMSVSAKTDAGTLMVQLIMLYFLVHYWKTMKAGDLLWAFGALLVSFTLKPTSIVFSSAVFGMSILYDLYSRKLWVKGVEWKVSVREWLILVPFAAEVIFIFARTWLMTGVPVTSVYTSLFQKLGFPIRYPFEMPEAETARNVVMSFERQFSRFLERLYGVFLCPENGEDMAHVIFAWGGLLFLFFLIMGILWLYLRRKGEIPRKKTAFREPSEGGYLLWVLLPVVLGSLYVLYSLSQIDGNYYNFPYALGIFAGCYGISRAGKGEIQRALRVILLPAVFMGIVMTSVTNWDWQIGLSPISVRHYGFFNHEQQEYEELANLPSGNQEIWTILSQDPRTRVIAVGTHPDTLLFPCNVQSYGDIAGSWGNPVMVGSVENFAEFAEYAKTEYVYIQARYMCRWEDPYPFLCRLIYKGVLTDLVFENGNVLAKVNPEGVHDAGAEEALERFYQNYMPAQEPVRLR